jgi:hypothetical protein
VLLHLNGEKGLAFWSGSQFSVAGNGTQYSEVPRERFEKDLSLFSHCEAVSISSLIKMNG